MERRRWQSHARVLEGGMWNGLGREDDVALEETETAHWVGRGSEEDVAGGRWEREATQK